MEVPSREGRVNPGPPGENRIDQRMPPEFVTDSLLPSRKAQGASCSGHEKPHSNAWDNMGAVIQAFSNVWWMVEGLSF